MNESDKISAATGDKEIEIIAHENDIANYYKDNNLVIKISLIVNNENDEIMVDSDIFIQHDDNSCSTMHDLSAFDFANTIITGLNQLTYDLVNVADDLSEDEIREIERTRGRWFTKFIKNRHAILGA